MTDMTKRRAELADKRSKRQCSAGNPDLDRAISWYLRIGFEDGWDARDEIANEQLADMQAQADEIMKSNKEMSDLIYSEDGYIESQESLIKERDTLKQQLEIAVKACQLYEQAFDDTGNDYSHLVCLEEAQKLLEQIQKMLRKNEGDEQW